MKVGIVGASGYTGGALLNLLFSHPEVEINMVTSRQYQGKLVSELHPNFRKFSKIKFENLEMKKAGECDFIFLAVPHRSAMHIVPDLIKTGVKVIDLSADFRLKSLEVYEKYYGEHSCPELFEKAAYGLPELHREEIKKASIIACCGCMATSSILALAPILKAGIIDTDHIICDAMMGSSGAGKSVSLASHHPERYGVIRPYKTVGHRHTAEINQELSLIAKKTIQVGFSAHAVNIVRGLSTTNHVYLLKPLEDKDVWKIYREFYKNEPFIRLIKQKKGIYRLPDPKILIGSNYCDIGFMLDQDISRLVAISALDNLVKGAAGLAVQCFNIINGFEETKGLEFPGFHPI
ncbi:MAG: N-acetyl-gamma-glutamyl-phosphate reductase [Candidatus Helarchaeota archaeon]|nr:N-acetyl-gamma-glutamyl-phosphate reductase [Candidatus Helarchaeota archaeon]